MSQSGTANTAVTAMPAPTPIRRKLSASTANSPEGIPAVIEPHK